MGEPRISELKAEIIILADIARGYREMLERRDGASVLDFRADDAVMEGLRRLAAIPTFTENGAASFGGDDFAFWTMFEGEPAQPKKRSASWWRQYHASRIRRED